MTFCSPARWHQQAENRVALLGDPWLGDPWLGDRLPEVAER